MFTQNAVRLLIADDDSNVLAAYVSFFQRFRSILKKPVFVHARAHVWACNRRAQRSFRWRGSWASRRDAGNLFMLGDLRSIRGFEFPEVPRTLPIILKNQRGDDCPLLADENFCRRRQVPAGREGARIGAAGRGATNMGTLESGCSLA